jgi:hypothetical protein
VRRGDIRPNSATPARHEPDAWLARLITQGYALRSVRAARHARWLVLFRTTSTSFRTAQAGAGKSRLTDQLWPAGSLRRRLPLGQPHSTGLSLSKSAAGHQTPPGLEPVPSCAGGTLVEPPCEKISTPLRIAAWLSVLGLVMASWTPGEYMIRTGVRGSFEHVGAYSVATQLWSSLIRDGGPGSSAAPLVSALGFSKLASSMLLGGTVSSKTLSQVASALRWSFCLLFGFGEFTSRDDPRFSSAFPHSTTLEHLRSNAADLASPREGTPMPWWSRGAVKALPGTVRIVLSLLASP